MEFEMLRIVLMLLFVILPMAAKADSYRTYEEVWSLASTVNMITSQRRQLGLDWAEAHTNALTKSMGRPWSCVKKEVTLMDLGGEVFQAALCMPATCRALPPKAEIEFYPNLGLTQKMKWFTVVFMTGPDTQVRCDNAYRQSQKTQKIIITW